MNVSRAADLAPRTARRVLPGLVEMAALLRADDRRGERADRRVAHRQRQDQAEPETTSGWVCLMTATNCCSRVGSR